MLAIDSHFVISNCSIGVSFTPKRWEYLLEKAKRAEAKLEPEEMERNFDQPMMKLQYVGTEKSASSVEVTEISVEKVKLMHTHTSLRGRTILKFPFEFQLLTFKADNPDKTLVYRPFSRADFNFQFSTLNLHDYSVSDE